MAVRVVSLILVLFIVSASTTDDEPAKCHIPEGHYNGEPVGFYDPEPRSGYTTIDSAIVMYCNFYAVFFLPSFSTSLLFSE